MYCGKCGKEISDDAAKCVHCGCPVGSTKDNATVQSDKDNLQRFWARDEMKQKNNGSVQSDNDKGGIGWLVLGVLTPCIGLFLYLYFLGSRPRSAKHAGSGALVGFCGCLAIILDVVLIGAWTNWGLDGGNFLVMLIITIPAIIAGIIAIIKNLAKKLK